MLRHFCLLAAIVMLASGCAVRKPIPFDEKRIDPAVSVIGVIANVPAVDSHFPGADCLLCIAAARAFHTQLTDYFRTLPTEDIPRLKSMVAERLTKRGLRAIVIPEPLSIDNLPNTAAPNGYLEEGFSPKDFSSYGAKYKIDKLLVINIQAIGVRRNYASYIPMGPPQAVFSGHGFMVNLKDGKYDWLLPISILKGAPGEWDQPPKFPALTNAYFEVLERGKEEILKPF
jgi:hypothetical protein